MKRLSNSFQFKDLIFIFYDNLFFISPAIQKIILFNWNKKEYKIV
ncbi:MAG: hypothetical protein OJF59_001921 [Cytophagales bacterium]|nr:MAG: hypothetical protein OJF59_001921 [Cytophagales bacterium]